MLLHIIKLSSLNKNWCLDGLIKSSLPPIRASIPMQSSINWIKSSIFPRSTTNSKVSIFNTNVFSSAPVCGSRQHVSYLLTSWFFVYFWSSLFLVLTFSNVYYWLKHEFLPLEYLKKYPMYHMLVECIYIQHTVCFNCLLTCLFSSAKSLLRFSF